jgi:adenylosuccinate lyase
VQTTGGSIRGYESGWNKAIDPVVLDALAELYRVPVSGLIAALKANRENPDLSDFEVELILRLKARAHDAQTVALSRIQEIGQRLAQIGAELDDFAIECAELIASTSPPAESRRQTPKTRNGPPHSNTDS